MKRKATFMDKNEKKLSELLFNKTNNLAEKLKSNNEQEIDLDLKPAWIDEDDDNFGANMKSKSLYTEKLKQKYETLMGTPKWAKLNREIKTEDGNDDDDNELLRTAGHLEKKIKSNVLKKDYLEIKSFPKINAATGKEGPIISCVEFHPKVSVALVAGQSGIASLFAIGSDDNNNKLHSFKLNNWRITAAQFSPDGSEAYIASKFSHSYCIYDLVKAEPKLVQLPLAVRKPVIFKLSSDGKYIATTDGFDEVYLIYAPSRELLKALKHNSKVASVAFSHDCSQLYSYGVQGEVTIWNLSTYRAEKKFYDNGCVSASCISSSPCGRLLATGSNEGIVNIYQTASLTAAEPIPQKVISNLTTKITNLTFNATSEILAMSSSLYPNAVKLVHIPSYHIFMNFPTQSFNLHQVDTVTFSPNSGYMALGNNKNSAYLYRLKYYKNY